MKLRHRWEYNIKNDLKGMGGAQLRSGSTCVRIYFKLWSREYKVRNEH